MVMDEVYSIEIVTNNLKEHGNETVETKAYSGYDKERKFLFEKTFEANVSIVQVTKEVWREIRIMESKPEQQAINIGPLNMN